MYAPRIFLGGPPHGESITHQVRGDLVHQNLGENGRLGVEKGVVQDEHVEISASNDATSDNDESMIRLISAGRPKREFEGGGGLAAEFEDTWGRRKRCARRRACSRRFGMIDWRLAIGAFSSWLCLN